MKEITSTVYKAFDGKKLLYYIMDIKGGAERLLFT